VLPKFIPHTRPVTVNRAASDTISVALTSQAYLDSLKQLRHKRGQWVRRIAFGFCGAGFTALGVYRNNEMQDAVDRKDAAYENYSKPAQSESYYLYWWDEVKKARADAKTLRKKRNAGSVVGGLFGIAFGISIPF